MFKHPLVLLTIGLITAITSQAAGQVPSGTKVGTLNCQLAPSIGFIVGSHQPMRCRYTPDGPFPPEFYDGVINTIGFDVGFTAGGAMAWAVVAPTVGPPRGGLAGVYVGASGSATAGVGSVSTYCLAARDARLLCNRCRYRAKQALTSRSG